MKQLGVAAVLVLAGCSPRAADAPPPPQDAQAMRREVWAAIQPLAAARGIDPGFIYALVKTESNFDARARRGEARGLMQLKPRGWKAVSGIPYDQGVLDWRTNLAVGIGSLASTRDTLAARGVFSYPILWASYHYGLDFVAARGFDMSRIPRPRDPVSYGLFSGEVHPLPPPK